MRGFTLKLNQRLWLLITSGIVFTVLMSYGLTEYLYEKLYVQQVESSLRYQGEQVAGMYKGGPLTGAFRQQAEKFNTVSGAEIYVTENQRELGACLPFEVEYNALITEEERGRLLTGKTVSKIGYEERFGRKIMAVIVPLLDNKRLAGIVYLYVPLATITEAFSEARYIVLATGGLFVLISMYAGLQIVTRLTKPLRAMEAAAGEMARGNFAARVDVGITDEVGRLGHALNHMASELAEVEQQRKEFLANVSHELRTPLSYIKGYSEAMIEGVVQAEDDKQRYVTLIHREAGRMQRLVHDLLDLARLEGETYPLTLRPLPLAQLVEDTLEKFCPFLEEKSAQLTMELDPDMIVIGDLDRLEQVIHNLCDNALRHLPENGQLTVTLIMAEGGRCRLTVEDNGPGIPEGELARIGERFYRVDKARNRRNGGSGLGLSIVRQIVHLHGGTWTIESTVGTGTAVSIYLPLYEYEEPQS
ncbi:signal transduction histidine kinase [Aneurinibacillus soli]|uniref:histidine kinase n=1 Tax=Aneurinibacillus soli TaxID=1500254 RepID=A0A0U5BAJ4_9BACL|nr:signal transduction histidine kinase [Aneurinibacillus soli]BAU27916.1 Sensor histidine kinase YycG [Aneurinibacillus soli]